MGMPVSHYLKILRKKGPCIHMYVLFFTMHFFALLTCINGRWIVPWIIGANATSGKFFFNSWIWIMPTHRIISICSTNKEMVRFVYLLKNSDVILAIHLKCKKGYFFVNESIYSCSFYEKLSNLLNCLLQFYFQEALWNSKHWNK